MEFWDENAAPAILAAVRAACETIKGNLDSELQERDRSRHVFLIEEVNRLKDAVAKTGQLEKENQQLQQKLEDLRKAQRPPRSMSDATTAVSSGVLEDTATAVSSRSGPPTHRHVLGELSPNKRAGRAGPDWEKDYMNLAKRYASLEARFETKQMAGRKVRDERNAWMKYAEKLEAKLKREKRRRNQSEAGAPESSAAIKPTSSRAAETIRPVLSASFTSNPESHSGPGQHDDAAQQWKHSRRAVSTPATATQRNDLAPAENNIETNDEDTGDDADPPELPALPQPLAPESRILIKQEPPSDDLVIVSEREVRKRKIQDDHDGMEPPARKIKCEYTVSSDPVVTAEITTFHPQESMDFDAGPKAFPTPKRQRFLGPEAYANYGSTVEGDQRQNAVFSAQTERAACGNQSRTVIKTTDDSAQERTTFSGDAVKFPRSRSARRTAEAGSGLTTLRKHSLQPSPDGDVAEPGSTIAQPTPRDRDDDHEPLDLDLEALRVLRERQARQNQPVGTPAESKPLNSVPAPRFPRNQNQSKTTKLRQRPVLELRIEDFKINPKLNNGHTHAYDEVVRDKASRAELPGCIDPNCCGKQFRAMAQSELNKGGLAILARKDDVELLESYLGDEAYRLIGMSLEDKRKLWLDAKTRDLANRFGRHRQRFARRPSPPGYWDPDFPSTQEVQANKAEALKIERGIIEERWREAMRGGGRWLFRDE